MANMLQSLTTLFQEINAEEINTVEELLFFNEINVVSTSGFQLTGFFL